MDDSFNFLHFRENKKIIQSFSVPDNKRGGVNRCIVTTNFQDKKNLENALTLVRLLHTKEPMIRRENLKFNYAKESLAMPNKMHTYGHYHQTF